LSNKEYEKQKVINKVCGALSTLTRIPYLKYEEDIYECLTKAVEACPVLSDAPFNLASYRFVDTQFPIVSTVLFNRGKWSKTLINELKGYNCLCVDSNLRGADSLFIVKVYEESMTCMDEISSLIYNTSTYPASVFTGHVDDCVVVAFQLRQLWQ
jgi:hypothetical protein